MARETMRRYNVSFVKNLLNSNGHRFKCTQGVFTIDAKSPAEAVDAAKEKFEVSIGDWRLYADIVEIGEAMGQPASG